MRNLVFASLLLLLCAGAQAKTVWSCRSADAAYSVGSVGCEIAIQKRQLPTVNCEEGDESGLSPSTEFDSAGGMKKLSSKDNITLFLATSAADCPLGNCVDKILVGIPNALLQGAKPPKSTIYLLNPEPGQHEKVNLNCHPMLNDSSNSNSGE